MSGDSKKSQHVSIRLVEGGRITRVSPEYLRSKLAPRLSSAPLHA